MRKLIAEQQPDLVFLSETLCKVSQARFIFRFSKYTKFFGVDVDGRKGGLFLMWSDVISFQIYDSSPHWIHGLVSESNSVDFLTTFVYGPPKLHQRDILWNFLLNSAPFITKPWLLAGDFNQVMLAEHKLSSCTSLLGAEKFQNVVTICGLIDIIPNGNWFSWSNRRMGGDAVLERLDRVLVNHNWFSFLPDMSVCCLPIVSSDHAPLCISTCSNIPRKCRPFKFEAMWLVNNACNDVVTKAWNEYVNGSPAYILLQKLKNTRHHLICWNKVEFGHVPSKVRELTNRLYEIQQNFGLVHSNDDVQSLLMQEHSARMELNEWLKKRRDHVGSKIQADVVIKW